MIGSARSLWNDALSHRMNRWNKLHVSTSYGQQCAVLTAERKSKLALRELNAQAAQEVLKRLDRAFHVFFENRARYPKFKKFSASGSFTYPQAYNGSVKPDVLRKRLFLSKVGSVRTVFHRPLPADSRLKVATVTREGSGKWFASLVYEESVPPTGVHTTAWCASPIGIDLGLKSLVATSDGMKIEHPRFLSKAEKRLKRLQRSLSSKQKHSMNRDKARRRLGRQNSRIANQRRDFNHKLSTKLILEHGLIAFENLGIANLVRNRRLAKSIQDAGWGQLVGFAEYKAAWAAKSFVRVPTHHSTQECWFCGGVNEVSLEERVFKCRGCHRELDRDINASRVVMKRGLSLGNTHEELGQDKARITPRSFGENPPKAVPESTKMPVEARLPYSSIQLDGASQVREAGTTRHETGAESPRRRDAGGCHSSCRSLNVPTLKPSGMFFISPILCPIIPFTLALPAASMSLCVTMPSKTR